MTYTLALQTPESPLKEEWLWETDLMTAYAGDEDRIPLLRYPKRAFSGAYEFDRAQDVRRHMAMMFAQFGTFFAFPLFQYASKLKAPVDVGGNTIAVNALRSDLRVDRSALVIEGDNYDLRTVQSVTADEVVFSTILANAYSPRAIVCPVTTVSSVTGSGFSRRNPDHSALASFRYMERTPWTPLIDPLNDATLTMFDGKAVIEQQAIGTQFENALDTGIRGGSYLGLPDVFSPLDQSQWAFALTWQVNRVFDLAAWQWWSVFADHVQGSSIPFLIPTQREDLVFVPAADVGLPDVNNVVVVEGTEYSQHYWGSDTFKRIFIDSEGGRHYALVTAVDQVDGNDRLTFAPAHPNTAPYYAIDKVGFLLKARIADDKITCDHYGLNTNVSLNLRTAS